MKNLDKKYGDEEKIQQKPLTKTMLGIIDKIMIKIGSKSFEEAKQDFTIKKYFRKRPGKLFWVCFLPEKTTWSMMKKYNLIPKKGKVLVYRISDAFLSTSPHKVNQLFRILKTDFAKEYKRRKLSNKKIGFWGLSIGTLPAFYFANKLKCKKLVAVCPTDKLGQGIFESVAAQKRNIKNGMITKGYSVEKYDQIIRKINPINNLKNLPHDIKIYLARFDNYIAVQGGERLVKKIKKFNKKITVKRFNLLGHFMTMILFGLLNRD